MIKDYLLPIVVQDFINVLEIYNISSYFIMFRLNKAKLKYSTSFRNALQELKSVNNLNDTEALQHLLEIEPRPRSGSELTAPPRGEEDTYWDTPHMNSPSASYELIDKKDNDFNDFILQQRIYLHELRKQHGEHRVGRLDGIVYAMSRVTLFMNWLEPNIIINQNIDRSILEIRYIDLMQVLSHYISIFSFDRALLRFHKELYSIDRKYFLNSGLYDAFFYGGKTLKDIDSIGNTLVNSLYLLSEAYVDQDQENKQSIFKFILTNYINGLLSLNNLNVEMFKPINEQVVDDVRVDDGEESLPPKTTTPDFFNSDDHEDLKLVDKPVCNSPNILFGYGSLSPKIVPASQSQSSASHKLTMMKS